MRANRIGFAFGMLAGAVAGVLLAPRRGAETRSHVRAVGHELADLATAPIQELARAAKSRRAGRARARRTPEPCEPTL